MVLMNNKLKSAEIKYQMENSGTTMLITEDEVYGPVVAPIRDEVQCKDYVVLSDEPIPDTIPFSALADKDAAEDMFGKIPMDQEDTAWIIYTSGTTGNPRDHSPVTLMAYILPWFTKIATKLPRKTEVL